MDPDPFEPLVKLTEQMLAKGMSREAVGLALIGAGCALLTPWDGDAHVDRPFTEAFIKTRYNLLPEPRSN